MRYIHEEPEPCVTLTGLLLLAALVAVAYVSLGF